MREGEGEREREREAKRCRFPFLIPHSPYRVWSWGWGVHGQLGLKSVDDKSLPAHVILLDKWQVSFIAAGYGHSAVLSSEVSNPLHSSKFHT